MEGECKEVLFQLPSFPTGWLIWFKQLKHFCEKLLRTMLFFLLSFDTWLVYKREKRNEAKACLNRWVFKLCLRYRCLANTLTRTWNKHQCITATPIYPVSVSIKLNNSTPGVLRSFFDLIKKNQTHSELFTPRDWPAVHSLKSSTINLEVYIFLPFIMGFSFYLFTLQLHQIT